MSGPFQGGPLPPQVAIVIVSFNTRDELLRCLSSLSHVSSPIEVVVVDNASEDGSAEAVARGVSAGRGHRAAPTNEGYAKANNRGWRATVAPFVLLLNSDTELRARAARDPRRSPAARGPRSGSWALARSIPTDPSRSPPGPISRRFRSGSSAVWCAASSAASAGPSPSRATRYSREHEPVWVSGACLLTRRAHLEAVGGLDEAFFLYEEDVDLCVRIGRLGLPRALHPRGRGAPPPRAQHGAHPGPRALRVPPQPPPLLPEASRAAPRGAPARPSRGPRPPRGDAPASAGGRRSARRSLRPPAARPGPRS